MTLAPRGLEFSMNMRDGGALAALTIELAKQADATTRSEPIAGRSGHDCLRHYLGWASEAANMISNYLTLGQSHEIIFTRAYWALANMDGGEPFVVTAIQDELRRQRRRLLELSSSAGELQEYWQTPERAPQLILIPDTNVYIHHPRRVDQVNWLEMANWAGSIRVVIPRIVVAELDNNKRNRYRAVKLRVRETLRLLENLLALGEPQPVKLSENDPRSSSREQRDVTIEFLPDPLGHQPQARADDEILARALHLERLTGIPVRIATSDTTMLLSAHAFELDAIRMSDWEDQT